MAAMRGDGGCDGAVDRRGRAGVRRTADETFAPTTGPAGSLLINVPAVIALQRSYAAQLRGDAEITEVYAVRALAELRPGELMLSSAVDGFLAVAAWMRGRLEQAERAFASSIAAWHPADQPTTTAWGCYSLARIQRARGRLDAASQTAHKALELAAARERRPLPAAGPALVILAELDYSATISTRRSNTSPRESRCAVSSCIRRRSPPV